MTAKAMLGGGWAELVPEKRQKGLKAAKEERKSKLAGERWLSERQR